MRGAGLRAPGGRVGLPAAVAGAILLILLGIGSWMPAVAQDSGLSEYEVKAAYLYNFARFVEWPAATAGPPPKALTICILGQDPFGDAFTSIAGKEVRGRTITVARRLNGACPDSCDILFISASERRRLSQILDQLGTRAVLTVSDIDGFSRAGGMIRFVLDGNKVHFEINVDAASRADLALSSKLLKLARVLRKRSD